MEKWTQKELEEVYQKILARAKDDPAFLQEVREKGKAALEEVAGRKLPEGFQLQFVDGESNYANAYVLPDFTGDEIDLGQLKSVVGGTEGDIPVNIQGEGQDDESYSSLIIQY